MFGNNTLKKVIDTTIKKKLLFEVFSIFFFSKFHIYTIKYKLSIASATRVGSLVQVNGQFFLEKFSRGPHVIDMFFRGPQLFKKKVVVMHENTFLNQKHGIIK